MKVVRSSPAGATPIDGQWWRNAATLEINTLRSALSDLLDNGRGEEALGLIESGLAVSPRGMALFDELTNIRTNQWPQHQQLLAAWVQAYLQQPEDAHALAQRCTGSVGTACQFVLTEMMAHGYDGSACWRGIAGTRVLDLINSACLHGRADFLTALQILLPRTVSTAPLLEVSDGHRMSLTKVILGALPAEFDNDHGIIEAARLLDFVRQRCADAPGFLSWRLERLLLSRQPGSFRFPETAALLLSGVELTEPARAALCERTYVTRPDLEPQESLPLPIAVVSCGEEMATRLLLRLHEAGADLDCLSASSIGTPLYHAVNFGQVKTVRMLLGLGADPKRGRDEIETPLNVAIAHASNTGEMEVLGLLRAALARSVAASAIVAMEGSSPT